MEKITSRKTICDLLFEMHTGKKITDRKKFAFDIKNFLLEKKIKFPLLEFAAQEIFDLVPENGQIDLTDKLISFHTIGGNVIAGKILQLRLEKHFKESFEKAGEYIKEGNEWYSCDIIGERVMGFSLLTDPEKTIPVLKKLSKDTSNWIVRTVGVATHYATKKGLQKKYVEEMFLLLWSLSDSSDLHIKTGTGWGAKTCVKFYPELAEKYSEKIASPEVKQWFKTKVGIGLSINGYLKEKNPARLLKVRNGGSVNSQK